MASTESPLYAPSGQGGYLLPAGYLSTQGGQIVDASGNVVRIASIGWNTSNGESPLGLWAASYQSEMDAIKADGFNTIRLPWYDATLDQRPSSGLVDYSLNPDLQGLTNIQIIDRLVTYAGQIGLKIILDHHGDEDIHAGQQKNGLWIDSGPGTDGTDGSGNTGTVDAAKFQADWVRIAQAFAGNATVIGFDLDNEPLASVGVTWGGGGPLDIHAMYEQVGDAIQAADPGALIIAEGPQNYQTTYAGTGTAPEGDLTAAGVDPVVLTVPGKLVYSVHEYPAEITHAPLDSGPDFVTQMNNDWGYLISEGIAPVWIGEIGSNMTSSDAASWADTIIPYLNGQDSAADGPSVQVSTSWWQAGTQTGNPDGIQTAWGVAEFRPEQQAVTDRLLFTTPPPAPNFTFTDLTSGEHDVLPGSAYSGPVAGLEQAFIEITPDNIDVSANIPDVFIHSGSGNDALAASGGRNVLDGGTGSNFLSGGSGTDTFFVDDRAAGADIWSTIAGFHSGDTATIWGIAPQATALAWQDRQGAAGYTGLTLHAAMPGQPKASLTLAGYTSADLTAGRLVVAAGIDPASGSPFMTISAA